MNTSIFKFKSLIFILAVLPSLVLIGQKEDQAYKMKEKMKAQRVAFITSELELTETESQKFWPIFNSYRSEIDELKAQNVKPSKNMTDKEAEDMMYSLLENRSKEIEIQKKYIQKLKTAIPPRKIAILFGIEKEFKEKIISNMKERKMQRRASNE